MAVFPHAPHIYTEKKPMSRDILNSITIYFKIKQANFSVLVKRVKMSAILQSIPACFENCLFQEVEQNTE